MDIRNGPGIVHAIFSRDRSSIQTQHSSLLVIERPLSIRVSFRRFLASRWKDHNGLLAIERPREERNFGKKGTTWISRPIQPGTMRIQIRTFWLLSAFRPSPFPSRLSVHLQFHRTFAAPDSRALSALFTYALSEKFSKNPLCPERKDTLRYAFIRRRLCMIPWQLDPLMSLHILSSFCLIRFISNLTSAITIIRSYNSVNVLTKRMCYRK